MTMKKILVQGIMYIEDEDYDPGENGPLTEEAFNEALRHLELDDVEFTLVP